MQWNMQSGNINNNPKVKYIFSLFELSATKTVMWNCHLDDSSKGMYEIILGRYILTSSALHLKLSEHVTKADYEPLKGSLASMVDLGTYKYRILNKGEITPR